MTSTEYQQLVEFLGHQFTEIDRRFTEVDRRFTQMGHRFDAMEGRFDAVDHQFVELRQETLGHFDPKRNVTQDSQFRTIANGNVLSGLIFKG